jgi:DNA-directed RNA polymerase alpha subunit
MSEPTTLQPTPELPDDTLLDNVELPTRTRNVFAAAGLRTVGEVREASDGMLVSLPNLGWRSVAHIRETLGLPSCDGVRPSGKNPV